MKGELCILLIINSLLAGSGCSNKPQAAISQDELVRRTQELANAVASGDQGPWKKYFAEDCIYADEKGRHMDKAALVADITPLPEGYSGTIKVVKAESRIEDGVAILSYDMDETEIIYGQALKARYHEIDTWLPRNGEWQIVAAQAMRYYEDPAAGEAEAGKYKEYVGRYEAAPGKTITVSVEEGKLFFQRGDRPRQELVPEGGPIFFRTGVEGRILFRRGGAGKVEALIDRRNNEDVVWKKVS